MVADGLPEKSVLLEGTEQRIEITPFRGNAVKRKLEEFLYVAVEQKAVPFRMVIPGKHGAHKVRIPAKLIAPSPVADMQIAENKDFGGLLKAYRSGMVEYALKIGMFLLVETHNMN